jgi:hypothetical protein
MYRYDNVADLEAWLTSDERMRLLEEGKKFQDFKLRTVDNSFGSWFAFDDKGNQAPPPSDIKTSFAVWVGIYPTAMTIMLVLSPLQLPLWLGTLVGNCPASSYLRDDALLLQPAAETLAVAVGRQSRLHARIFAVPPSSLPLTVLGGVLLPRDHEVWSLAGAIATATEMN